MSAASCQPWPLETGNCVSPGRGWGDGIHRPQDSLTLPAPHRAGLQPHRWALLLPRADAWPPAPVLSAAHLPFTVGSRKPESPGSCMMVKPGPTRQARRWGPQHGRPPHPPTPGTGRLRGFLATAQPPGQAHSSPMGPLLLSSEAGSGQALPICIIPRARRSGLFSAEGPRPLSPASPHHARLTPAELQPQACRSPAGKPHAQNSLSPADC